MSEVVAATSGAVVAAAAVETVSSAVCQSTLGHLATLDLVVSQQSAVMLGFALGWLFFGKFIFGDRYWFVVAWVSIAFFFLLDMPSENGVIRQKLPDQIWENTYVKKYVPEELKLGATVKDIVDSVANWPILQFAGRQIQKLHHTKTEL
jgi:hypothetical protein